MACVHAPRSSDPTPSDGTPQPSDGVTVSLPLREDAAHDTVVHVLEAHGYVVANRRDSRSFIRTMSRNIGGDTSIVVSVQIVQVDEPTTSSILALSATYSVPSRGLRDEQLRQIGSMRNSLWAKLTEMQSALLRIAKGAR
ncbi:MAG: hypothetical protein ABJE10_20965 [bacterium]